MQFPPTWELVSPDQFETFGFRPMETRHAGLEVVTLYDGGRLGEFRIVTGGNRILSVKFAADRILGPKFSGKQTKYSGTIQN